MKYIYIIFILISLNNMIYSKGKIVDIHPFNHDCTISNTVTIQNKVINSFNSNLKRKKYYLASTHSKNPTNAILIHKNHLEKIRFGKQITSNILSNEGINTLFKYGSHNIAPLFKGYDVEIKKDNRKEQLLIFKKKKKTHSHFTRIEVKIDKFNNIIKETILVNSEGNKIKGKATYKFIREDKKSRKKTPYFKHHTYSIFNKNDKKFSEFKTEYLECKKIQE